ncbi:hypothetical protein [Microvirga antarctica]|uniref:hypothetical protein n=1 Tax=Microvirga antarctica TaxID=2819233 RepID=UPI001B313D7A|nr:hypothetical protein [Microvirga antarctica]
MTDVTAYAALCDEMEAKVEWLSDNDLEFRAAAMARGVVAITHLSAEVDRLRRERDDLMQDRDDAARQRDEALKALEAIAEGEGGAVEIARQTLSRLTEGSDKP